MLSNEQKLGGIGASEVGKLFTANGLKSKTAQTLLLEKTIELITGERKRGVDNYATMHGKNSEHLAFEQLIKPNFPTAIYQSDESIPLFDGCWVTPDVIDYEAGITFDIKCPFTIQTFWDNINNVKKGYQYQVNMQMIGTNHKQGYLVYYLTHNDFRETEYNIPLQQRFKFFSIVADESIQKEEISRIKEFLSIRDKLYPMLCRATAVSDEEQFYLSEKHKVTPLKAKSNVMNWDGKLIVNQENEYFTLEKVSA